MKRILTILLAGCALSCARPQTVSAQEYKTHISKEFTPAKPASATLAIYNVFGSIKVEGYAGNKVMIEVDEKITAKTEADLAQGKAEVRFEIEQDADTIIAYIVEPYDSRPNRNWNRNRNDRRIPYKYFLSFTVKVPYAMNLKLSTVNDGDVLVKDVTGDMSVHNVNGDIGIANAKDGAIDARTINGDLIVSHTAMPPTDSKYYTLNGRLEVTYPANLSADLAFKTMNGAFYTDFPDVVNLPTRVVKTENKKAEGTVFKLNMNTEVRVGNGGRNYKFETLNGNIYIKKQS